MIVVPFSVLVTFNENDKVDPETGQDREGYRFLAVLFKNCWIEQKWEYGRIHLDDQGIIHFSISKDRKDWIMIPMSNPQHPRYVLPASDLDAIIGSGSTHTNNGPLRSLKFGQFHF